MNTLDLHKQALRLCEFHCEIRDVQKDANDRRIVRGYASTSDVDRYDEIVDPKAFKSSIKAYMKNGIVLLDHNPSKRIGLPVAYEINDKGLWFEAMIANGLDPTDLLSQTWNEIEQGILKAFSIGFRVMKVEEPKPGSEDQKNGAYRRITDLELYEISAVGIPANRSTMFSVGKGLLLGSDAPVDLYHRGYWPDQTDQTLHSLALVNNEGVNEGVEQGEDTELAEMVALQVQASHLRARE